MVLEHDAADAGATAAAGRGDPQCCPRFSGPKATGRKPRKSLTPPGSGRARPITPIQAAQPGRGAWTQGGGGNQPRHAFPPIAAHAHRQDVGRRGRRQGGEEYRHLVIQPAQPRPASQGDGHNRQGDQFDCHQPQGEAVAGALPPGAGAAPRQSARRAMEASARPEALERRRWGRNRRG